MKGQREKMHTDSVKVRTGGKVVATIEVPVYENLDDLIASEKAEVIVAKFNSQNSTDLANAERAKHRPATMGKAAKKEALMNCLTTEEFMGAVQAAQEKGTKATDELAELIESSEIQARLEAKLAEPTV